MRDIHAHDAALADEGDAVSQEMMRRLVAGESPIRLWREHRRLTRTELAEQAQIDKTYLSQLESGRKVGSVAALRRLAAMLSVDLDDLVANHEGARWRSMDGALRRTRTRHLGTSQGRPPSPSRPALARKPRQPPRCVMSRAPSAAKPSQMKPFSQVPSASSTLPSPRGAGMPARKPPT